MRRTVLWIVVATLVAVVGLQASTVVARREGNEPTVRSVDGCVDESGSVASVVPPAVVPLVADLDRVTPRPGPVREAVLAAADELLAGTIPAVTYPGAGASADPLRYLFDQGVALRRTTGTLAYAYAVRHDPRYLDALAAQTLAVVRWPDWNPGHPLDTVQLATDVALGLSWSGARMTPGQRAEVATVLSDRFLAPYACDLRGALAARRTGRGNQAVVAGSAALLAGIAVRAELPALSRASLVAATAALGRSAAPDGSGRSIADGPTDEGFMYTTYEAASLALVDATLRLLRVSRSVSPAESGLSTALEAALPSFDALAAWTEHCGQVAEPALQDGWDTYPWVDRTTALAAITASVEAGPRVRELLDELQAQARLTLPGVGVWPVPDAIGELVLAGVDPDLRGSGRAAGSDASPGGAYASGGALSARRYGCATSNGTYALLTAVPDDSPHAHSDVGNVLVRQGSQEVLTDLGQRDYSFHDQPVWRAATAAHSTVGVGSADGSVSQTPTARGSVMADAGGLLMTSTDALPGVSGWQRRVVTGDGTVTITDSLTTAALSLDPPTSSVPISMAFLLATPPASVVTVPPSPAGTAAPVSPAVPAPPMSQVLRATLPDGEVWELTLPIGVDAVVTDAQPQPPYVDADSAVPLGVARTLVTLHVDVPVTPLPTPTTLTTTLRRMS